MWIHEDEYFMEVQLKRKTKTSSKKFAFFFTREHPLSVIQVEF